MVFSSNIFLLFFLPLFIVAYFATPDRFRNHCLLLFSLLFYAYGAPTFIAILLLACVANFFIVKKMSSCNSLHQRKIWCAISIVLSLSLLLYFKYANFIVENANALCSLLNWNNIEWTNVALPIGISFFTFQSISYTIDVFRATAQPADKPLNYILYITMFPQLIAGPIVRYNCVAENIISRQSSMEERVSGFYRFAIGLAKKVLVANVLGSYADCVFNTDAAQLATSSAWIGMFAYTFQIYFDFSGYSDMAIGIGKMLGFKFPENFDSPYTSQSISEFWRRWHITLGAFMKEYLYIPLGGNRCGKSRTYLNLAIVFLLSGLWHGAAYNFILWGAYHGLFLIADRIFMLKLLNRIGRIPSTMLTFIAVAFGWVLFRADNLTQAAQYFATLFSADGSCAIAVSKEFVTIMCVAVLFSFITMTKWGKSLNCKIFDSPYSAKTATAMGLITIVLMSLSIGSLLVLDFNPFIYFRF